MPELSVPGRACIRCQEGRCCDDRTSQCKRDRKAGQRPCGRYAHHYGNGLQVSKILAPAMNTAMYENPVVQDNIRKLQTYGYEVITPASGYLACGDTGAGKMPEPETLLEYILKEAAFQKDLAGKKLLVTAGPTQEAMTRSAVSPTIHPERWDTPLQKWPCSEERRLRW